MYDLWGGLVFGAIDYRSRVFMNWGFFKLPELDIIMLQNSNVVLQLNGLMLFCVEIWFYVFRDKLELKAVQDGSESYAALEKKAEIYNKLVKGELSDGEDEEKYCVDFFRKGLEHEPRMSRENDTSSPQAQTSQENVDADDGDDFLPIGAKGAGVGRASAAVDRSQHKHFVM